MSRRAKTAAIASAHASGPRKHGTRPAVDMASACSTSGTIIAAIGVRCPALSTIGWTASCGWNLADEPIVASTRSNSGASSKTSSAAFITSGLTPARVRSTTRPGDRRAPGRAIVAALGRGRLDGDITNTQLVDGHRGPAAKWW